MYTIAMVKIVLIFVFFFVLTSSFIISEKLIAGSYTDRILVSVKEPCMKSFEDGTYFHMKLDAPNLFNATFHALSLMSPNVTVDECVNTYVCYFEYNEPFEPASGSIVISVDVETLLTYEYELRQQYELHVRQSILGMVGVIGLAGFFFIFIILPISFIIYTEVCKWWRRKPVDRNKRLY